MPGIHFVSGQVRPKFGDRSFQFSRNMTIIQDGDDLALVNTLRLDDAGLARLDALGTVKNLVRLGAFHGRDDAFYKDRYNVPIWAPAGTPHERGVTTDTELVHGQAGPCAGSSVFIYETSNVPEALLHLDRHGGVLISCDSLQNWAETDQYFDEVSAAFMAKSGFIRPANVGPGWRRAAEPEASDFERIKKMKFKHLLSAHGAPLLDEAHEALSETFAELF